jgi:hypothetical protein
LRGLLAAYDEVAPARTSGPLAPADECDEQAARPARGAHGVDLAALEARVANARLAVARTAGIIRPEARGRVEAVHRAVVDAEQALFDARKKDKAQALARYQAALGAERAVLGEAGVESYAQFLVTIAQGVPAVDLEARLRAETDLADAQTALHHARQARHPDADADAVRDELRRTLGMIGVAPERDVVAQARRVVAGHVEHPGAVREPGPAATAEKIAVDAEMTALGRECEELDDLLAAFERELADLDEAGARDSATIDADARRALLDALFACYRHGDLLAGRLPIVVDGAFDGLAPGDVRLVADQLGVLDDIQVVVVTSDPEVERALRHVGARSVAIGTSPVCVGGADTHDRRTLLRRRGA